MILGMALMAICASSFAQQEAMNAQFIMNTMVLNPAYAGYNEVQSVTLNHRSQWIGFEGAPITNSLGFDMVLPRFKEIAIGGVSVGEPTNARPGVNRECHH